MIRYVPVYTISS